MIPKLLPTLLMAATMVAAPVRADELVAEYDVEILNLTVMKVSFSTNFSTGIYGAKMKARTSGVAGFLAEIKIDAETAGTIKEGRPSPHRFNLVRSKDGEEKNIKLAWNRAGLPSLPDNFSEDEKGRLRASFQRKTEDPLSVILKIGLSGEKPCQASYRAFDGRDAYDMAFTVDGGNVAKGLECSVNARLVAGRDFEKFRNTGKGQLDYNYEIRMEAVDLDGTRAVNVPTRVSGRLQGRKFTARLRGLKVNGKALRD